mgnify:CR=1 FL=1
MKSIENAKKKAERRYGKALWGHPNSSFAKREYAPGQHGQRRKKQTDYGEQLYAKQSLKSSYGNIGEKQFHKYYVEAIRRKGDTAENLIGLLESRLDNLVYRSKFVPTVFAARQFVNHGHVLVNGKKVNIPSYLLKAGDVIEVREKSKQLPMVIAAVESTSRDLPGYLEVDSKKLTAIDSISAGCRNSARRYIGNGTILSLFSHTDSSQRIRTSKFTESNIYLCPLTI